MAPSLVVCPSCACHVRASEPICPLCSARIAPTSSGSLPRTAAAVAMGLAVVALAPACGDDTGGSGATGQGGEVTADYGVGPTGSGGGGGDATTSASGSTGEGGATASSSGSGGEGGEVTADYGVGPTTSSTTGGG